MSTLSGSQSKQSHASQGLRGTSRSASSSHQGPQQARSPSTPRSANMNQHQTQDEYEEEKAESYDEAYGVYGQAGFSHGQGHGGAYEKGVVYGQGQGGAYEQGAVDPYGQGTSAAAEAPPPPPPKTYACLAPLANQEMIMCKQDADYLEAICCCEIANRYTVSAMNGLHLYICEEDSNFCCRNCCGTRRSWRIRCNLPGGKPGFVVRRPYRCANLFKCFECCHGSCLCCSLCQEKVEVYDAATGDVWGGVSQAYRCLNDFLCCCSRPCYTVRDSTGNTVYKIKGPICQFTCPFTKRCRKIDFKIYQDGQVVGKISKHWSGLLKEGLSDADNFGIEFPKGATPEMKAVLIGALFLIDFMHFETEQGKGGDIPIA